MAVFRIEIQPVDESGLPVPAPEVVTHLADAGLVGVTDAIAARLFFLEGHLDQAEVARIAGELLASPVTDQWTVSGELDDLVPPATGVAVEVHLRPGVMDPIADSTLAELRAEGLPVERVRTARRYIVDGDIDARQVVAAARRSVANDCIERVVVGAAPIAPAPQPPVAPFERRHVRLRGLSDEELLTLSRAGHLFLSLDEMRAIRDYFEDLQREPTDLELETLAQTWSEHCVHKTLKSAVTYAGAPLPGHSADGEVRFENLLKETIAAVTFGLRTAGRGPECWSVFEDNAGVIRFDEEFGVAFKVETHNHPSAIEPYGGAATGIGGCIRDVIGCGRGARPIASTDVFCVAPVDWPLDELPGGVLHPWRVLRGVVAGVADYGNRMGIPTVNGAVQFDPRYLGNPLVYCGSVGLIPRSMVTKAARPGDRIVVVGGRTGRDGIHGATFSSAELTDTHVDEFSHAVQIGNAITEKRFLDALLQARDSAEGCLYSAITDCGAGGLSSAVGEMGAEVGAVVDLEKVPLKYAGLRYDEIWISEAQERMVVAVPPANLPAFMALMAREQVEATDIGAFGHELLGDRAAAIDAPRLVCRYEGTIVGELAMAFLHDGVPKLTRAATWQPVGPGRVTAAPIDADQAMNALPRRLGGPNVASRAWIIRKYDHEVQGGSTIKPLCGPGRGPADAAVLRPRLDSSRGVALGCGLAPHLFEHDPYWMAAAGIDEAIRNVVCVGGDPRQTAVLDNFCWGRCDDPHQMGALVRACVGCRDAATVYGTPFISGKDSLNNEFALGEADVDMVCQRVEAYLRAERTDLDPAQLAAIVARIRRTRRLSIPGTLLISAVSIVPDVRRCVTPDLKQPGNRIVLVGGLAETDYAFEEAAAVHSAVADAIADGRVAACHDVSDGGWLVALAEMALAAGGHGARIGASADGLPPAFAPRCATYVVESAAELGLPRGVPAVELGEVTDEPVLRWGAQCVDVESLRRVWSAGGAG